MRSTIIVAFAALIAAGCSKPSAPASTSAPAAAAANAPPGSVEAGPTAQTPNWVRDQWATLPEWNNLANISEGGKLMFNPRTIMRDSSAGTTDVRVQVLHLEPVPYIQDSAKTRVTTWYFKERATYRFRCAARTYMVTQRDFMGTGDAIVGSEQNDTTSESAWRPIDASGPARVLEGPVCKAA